MYDESDSDDDAYFSLSVDAVLKAIRKACPTDTSGPKIYALLSKLNDTLLTSAVRVHTNWATIHNNKMGPLSRSVFLGNRWSGMLILISGVQLMRKERIRKALTIGEAELRAQLNEGEGNNIRKMVVWSEKWRGLYLPSTCIS